MPAFVWRQSQLDLTPPSPWIDRSRVSMVGKVFFSLPHLSTNARVDDCTLHKTLSSSGVIFVERGGTSKFVPFFSALTPFFVLKVLLASSTKAGSMGNSMKKEVQVILEVRELQLVEIDPRAPVSQSSHYVQGGRNLSARVSTAI